MIKCVYLDKVGSCELGIESLCPYKDYDDATDDFFCSIHEDEQT